MQRRGHYKLPNPWGFVEVAKQAIENGGDNYIGFSWFGEKEDPVVGQTKAYCCPDCQNLIINSIKRINRSFDRKERKTILAELYEKADELNCGHYKEFQKELEDMRSSDKRKTPQRRLQDYYTDVINENTGAELQYPDELEL